MSSAGCADVMAQRYVTKEQKKAEKAERRKAENDTVPLLKSIAVSYDLVGTIMRMAGDYGQYEAAVRLNFRDRYFGVIEAGLGTANHATDAITGIALKTSAPYFRIGADVNLAKNKHDDYRLYLGARYAFTSFKQEIYGDVEVPYWGGTVEYAMSEESCSYHWGELLFGIDAKLWGPVRLGWSVRYKAKFFESTNENEDLWYIPGFGKDGTKLSGTFNIIVELARKNKKVVNL